MVDKEQVKEVLDAVRPSLQADGGDVALVDVTDDGSRVPARAAPCPR